MPNIVDDLQAADISDFCCCLMHIVHKCVEKLPPGDSFVGNPENDPFVWVLKRFDRCTGLSMIDVTRYVDCCWRDEHWSDSPGLPAIAKRMSEFGATRGYAGLLELFVNRWPVCANLVAKCLRVNGRVAANRTRSVGGRPRLDPKTERRYRSILKRLDAKANDVSRRTFCSIERIEEYELKRAQAWARQSKLRAKKPPSP